MKWCMLAFGEGVWGVEGRLYEVQGCKTVGEDCEAGEMKGMVGGVVESSRKTTEFGTGDGVGLTVSIRIDGVGTVVGRKGLVRGVKGSPRTVCGWVMCAVSVVGWR